MLLNVPVPLPSVVWFPVTSGLAALPQQTPRAVIGEPPSELMEEVITIDVAVSEVEDEVPVITGNTGAGVDAWVGDDLLHPATNKIAIITKYAGMDFINALFRLLILSGQHEDKK